MHKGYIYKITSPSEKIYIGQTINIGNRKAKYKWKGCGEQPRIHRSIKKYGWDNHTFEVVEECPIELINERERYWQDYYNVTGKSGLNCLLTSTSDKKMVHSEETKRKISETNKGRICSPETRKRISIANKGKKISAEAKARYSKERHSMYGKNHTEDTRLKMSLSSKGKKKKQSHCDNISKGLTGRKRKFSETSGSNSSQAKGVIDIESGIFYDTIMEVCIAFNLNPSYLYGRFSGKLNNKTKFRLI